MDESEIPIDIHTNKLLEWLVSRRHISKDWSTNVIKVREKINSAIQDMPVHEGIAKLLSGSYINYYHCQSIVEILKETESGSKNLFGMYGSQRMKDWVEILKLYEKDNLYLGEVASLLLRNVNYEIPALRKQITRLIHMQQEYNKKEADYEKQATSFKNDFNSSCKALGIPGKKIRTEFIEKAKDFPTMNKKLADSVKSLKKAVEFYKAAVTALLPDTKMAVLPILTAVIEKGDITIYELNRGVTPSSIEAIDVTTITPDEEEEVDKDSIDFGGEEIDFGGDGEDIDWGISTEDTQDTVEVVQVEKTDENIAKGDEARTILSHPPMRAKFLNDLLELEAFLKLRKHECSSEADGLSVSMLPEALQTYEENAIKEMLLVTSKLLSDVNDPTSMHYLNISTNVRYVDQLTKQLQQKLNNHTKMLAAKESVKIQRADSIEEKASIQPKVELLIEKSKELQDRIERDISKRYNGRPVNLMGGVHTLHV